MELFGSEQSNDAEPRERPTACGPMTFHSGTEEALLAYVREHAPAGDPADVLRAVDEFCHQRHWMMHIGDQKRRYLENAIVKRLSEAAYGQQFVELGSYCGYSAVVTARLLAAHGGTTAKLYCVEADKNCVRWTRELVEISGLSNYVTVLHGKVEDAACREELRKNLLHGVIDLLFVDHEKTRYFPDVVLLEGEGFLGSGSVVVADNVKVFNLVDYLAWVRDPEGPFQSSEYFEDLLEYCNAEDERKDAIEISVHR